jgi:hypothetical protein
MVNTEEFIKRLGNYTLIITVSMHPRLQCTLVYNVQFIPSTSGRNKPSLDFVLKILDIYPEVDLY